MHHNTDFGGPVGVCAHSGKLCRYDELVKQYTIIGNELVWTGLMVLPEELDELNEQALILQPKGDPKVVENLSPYKTKLLPSAPNNLIIIEVTANTITLSWEVIKNAEFYNIYWTDNFKTYNLLNNLIQNNYDPFNISAAPFCLPLQNIPLYKITDLSPDTSYLLQVSSINEVHIPVFEKSPYIWSNGTSWSYYNSQPTLINYAVVATTLGA